MFPPAGSNSRHDTDKVEITSAITMLRLAPQQQTPKPTVADFYARDENNVAADHFW